MNLRARAHLGNMVPWPMARAACAAALLLLAAPRAAYGDEPAAGKAAVADDQPHTPPHPLQVAGPPIIAAAPEPVPEPPRRAYLDGAGPRITFGRVWDKGLDPGFYGRFETEYFEVRGPFITGALLGLEGWGSEGATAGGGSIPVSIFGGVRGGPFEGPKAPLLFLSLGVGADALILDRLQGKTGFGLFSPFAAATAGMEITPGLRVLFDDRASYRWRLTAESGGRVQIGLTVALSSLLWDGPRG